MIKKILFGLLGLLFTIPSWALPAGYTELEYIESTGTQYIDTGIKELLGTSSFSIQTTVAPQDNSALGAFFGNKPSASRTTGFSIFLRHPTQNVIMYARNSEKTFTVSNYYDGNFHNLDITYNGNGSGTIVIDGRSYQLSDLSTDTVYNGNNYYVFATNDNGNGVYRFNGKTKTITVTVAGTVKLNLVPAQRNSDGVIGMYDTVSGTFFTNSGTGDFIAGPIAEIKVATTKYTETVFNPLNTALANAISVVDSVVSRTITQAASIATLQSGKQTRPDETCPAGKKCLLVEDASGVPHWYEICGGAHCLPEGYTELEYIQSDGASWIDTGITGTQDTAIETKFVNMLNDSSTTVLIGDGWTDGSYLLSIVAQTGAPNRIGGLNNMLRDFWRVGQDYIVKMDKTGLYVNNSKINWDGSATEFTTTKPLYLLGDPAASNRRSYAMLYYMKIYNNGTLVRDFIPAKNASGAIGMYDTVGGRFYTNAGSGEFIAGPVAE